MEIGEIARRSASRRRAPPGWPLRGRGCPRLRDARPRRSGSPAASGAAPRGWPRRPRTSAGRQHRPHATILCHVGGAGGRGLGIDRHVGHRCGARPRCRRARRRTSGRAGQRGSPGWTPTPRAQRQARRRLPIESPRGSEAAPGPRQDDGRTIGMSADGPLEELYQRQRQAQDPRWRAMHIRWISELPE